MEPLEQRQLLSASPINLTLSTSSPDYWTTVNGNLKTAAQVDQYRFTAPVTTTLSPLTNALVVREVPGTSGSTFPASLTLYNANQQPLTSLYPNPSGSYVSRVVIPVTAGSVYYAKATGLSGGTGPYQLQICVDDVGDTFAQAATLNLPSNGSGSQNGMIDYPGDVDFYKFTAPATGNMGIQQVARQVSGQVSSLNSFLYVYGSNQSLIAENNDAQVPGMATTLNSLVVIPVTAGSTYYVEAASFGSTTGAYSLLLNTDVAPQTFATANPIIIPADPNNLVSGPVKTQGGKLNYPSDVNMYSFVAPITGQMTILQIPDPSQQSTLACHIYLYDANHNLISQNESDFSQQSRITLSVAAGNKYFVEAASHNGTTGAYLLQFSTQCTLADNDGHTPAAAMPLTLAADGSGTQTGAIAYLGPALNVPATCANGDVDFFSFVAPASGQMNFRETVTSGSLIPDLYFGVLDSSNNFKVLGTAAGLGSTVEPTVSAGTTYYVEAAGNGLSAGNYTIQWFFNVQSALGLKDPVIANLVQQDGTPFTWTDMLQVLEVAANNSATNGLSAIDMHDLKVILSHAAQLQMPNYVQVLGDDVVYGSTANAHYQGQSLGNLAVSSPQAQVQDLINKWFLGLDHPVAQYTDAMGNTQNCTYTAAGSTLYGASGPTYLDMDQGELGDCYFLSSCGAISKSNPAAITNMILADPAIPNGIVPNGILPGGYDAWTIRFYNNGVPDFVTVDNQLPTVGGQLVFDGFGQTPGSAVLWLPLLEKAYAQWNEVGNENHGGGDDGINSYMVVQGGWPDQACTQMLGQTAQSVLDWPGNLTAAGQSWLVSAIQANEACCVGTNIAYNPAYPQYPEGYDPATSMFGGHAYMVGGYNAASQTFILYNPWGIDEPTGSGPGGAMTWAQIMADCDYMSAANTAGSLPISAPASLGSSSAAAQANRNGPDFNAARAAAANNLCWVSTSNSAATQSPAGNPSSSSHHRAIDLALLLRD
jgi:hypothetical protein